jgi:3',5'-cyclic AMP phosphodiesterase CpdA
MAALHDHTALDMVVTAGDNIYPDGSPDRFRQNFERPFEPMIRRSVPVYATLGNHDVRSGGDAQVRYPLFNMGGRNYYAHTAGGGMVELFMLDSNMMDRDQIAWVDTALGRSTALWKIAVFHHPPFSSGKKHGSDEGLRSALHPVLARHGVRAVFNGHDHFYQRVTPQDGVQYFVSGAGGKIRVGNLKMADPLVAAGYDDDSHFMVVEADAARLSFRAVNVDGRVVDEGTLEAAAQRAAA